jgi:phage shock protein E
LKIKIFISIVIAFVLLILTVCNKNGIDLIDADTVDENNREGSYMNVTPEKAKEIMDSETGYIILDVRQRNEYEAGHIKGAILIPDNEIEKRAETELTDKNQAILVYCRSGRRSAKAADLLAKLGYTNVINFGGILDWKYGTVRD